MPFNPMLATNLDPSKFKGPYLASLKLEGVRGAFYGDMGLLSRQLKYFRCQQMNEHFADVAIWCQENGITLEGEFYNHGWEFTRIDSATDRTNNPDGALLEFWIHDAQYVDGRAMTFEERYELMRCACGKLHALGYMHVRLCEQWPITTLDEALRAYQYAIDNRYEGLVLKDPKQVYKNGRSTVKSGHFLRLKPEDPYDAFILDIVERKENLCESKVNELGYLKKAQDKDMKASTGLAAVAVCYCPAEDRVIRVSLTRGLKDYEDTEAGPSRRKFWEQRDQYIGKVCKFVGIPVKGMAPRSPRWDSFRTDLEPYLLCHDGSDTLLATFDAQKRDDLLSGSESIDQISFEVFRAKWLYGCILGQE